MRKFLILPYLLLITFLSEAQNFTVNAFEVDIYINEAGYFDVVEKYDIEFDMPKHGIFRTLQVKYDLINEDNINETRRIKIKNIEVPGHNFEAPPGFIQRTASTIDIKIGDADKYVDGRQQYEIRYRVENAFLHEKDFIRFYWNIKTGGWLANFNKIDFRIHPPANVQLTDEDAYLYSGPSGTTNLSQDFDLNISNGILVGSSKPGVISGNGDNVTTLINLPLGSVAEASAMGTFWDQFGWSVPWALIIMTFYSVWRKYGKDDKVVATTSYYPPKDVDPAMAGFLINDREDTSDIISMLPYWGSKGYLEIEEIPKSGIFTSKDTKMRKLKELPEGVPEYESTVFNKLFGSSSLSRSEKAQSRNEIMREVVEEKGHGELLDKLIGTKYKDLKDGEVLISTLKNSFYTTMHDARVSLKKKAQIYYLPESKKVKGITLIVLLILTVLSGFLGLFIWGIIGAVALSLTCIVLMIVNTHMVKRNAKGNEVLSELKGFKNFIKVAEENKLKMLLKEDPNYYESTMAFALSFGMFKTWSKKFAALNLPPPSWYHSTSANHNMNQFSNAFSSSISHIQTNFVSSPSSSGGGSSGGGSSGGGFGGGGGGSW